jgi:hypothetical protein
MKVKRNLQMLEATKCHGRRAIVARTGFVGPRLSLAHRGLQRKVKRQRSKGKSQKQGHAYPYLVIELRKRGSCKRRDRISNGA